MRVSAVLLFALVLAGLAATPALAEKRVALVIGNGAYETVPALPNPANDAAAIAAKLQQVGFEVMLRTDLDQAGMAGSLAEFATALQGADVALFYYGGHGIQYAGQNYLLATNAQLSDPATLEVDTVLLDRIVVAMESAAPINLVFLDACRDNPFVGRLRDSMPAGRSAVVTRAPAPIAVTGADTMIVYATAPNRTAADGAGEHSPFANALLEHLATPGVEVSLVLKRVVQDVRESTVYTQSPEILSAMAAEFYFATPEQAAAAAPGEDFTAETAAYREAAAANSAEAWRQFLGLYPDSTLTAYARDALILVEARTATYDPARSFEDLEQALSLSGDDREAVETTLVALGYELEAPNGEFDPSARKGIFAFQVANGLMPTGYVDAATRGELMSEEVQHAAARDFESSEGLSGETAERALQLTASEIEGIKHGLSALRLSSDPTPGQLVGSTRAAIKQLQFQRGMTPDGFLTAETAEELLTLGRKEGPNLAHYVDAATLAPSVDPRLRRVAEYFTDRQIKYGSLEGTLYVAVLGQIQFDDALADAEAAGGHLAVYSSPEEKQFIDELLTGDDRFWMCGETFCWGAVVGYFQAAAATQSAEGWTAVTGEAGDIPWAPYWPNVKDSSNATGFAVYGNEGPVPLFTLVDFRRFEDSGTGYVLEVPAP